MTTEAKTDAKNEQTDEIKTGKQRSPNYPSLDLKEAIAKAKQLYLQAKTHPVGLQALSKIWDYGFKSSSFAMSIGALNSYGLIVIEGKGDQRKIGISKSGERIVESAPDADALIRQAALKPKMFAELWKKYGGKLPSDSVLETELRWNKDYAFNKNVIGVFISKFKATIQFANLGESDIIHQEGGDETDSEDGDSGESEHQNLNKTPPPPKGNMKNFAFPMSSGDVVTITAPHPMTEDDFDMLLAIMQAAKRGFLAPKKSAEAEA